MEVFVAESQEFLLVKFLHASARSEEKWLFSQAMQSKLRLNAWGVPGGGWAVLELTGILTSLSNKPPTL